MNVPEAVAILERRAHRALVLANAERGPAARKAGDKHRELATAIAVVLAALPEGAR